MATRKKKHTRRHSFFKSANKRKDELVKFRLTKEQKALIEKAAEFEDLSMSSWVRKVVIKEAREVLE